MIRNSARLALAALLSLAITAGVASATTIRYEYDALQRVVQVTYDTGTRISYGYDAAGNMVSRVVTLLTDTDTDGIPDAGDNCPTVANPDQADSNGNGIGDACDPQLDSDGDGLPDYYERAHGFDPHDPNDALADADGDGVSNRDEYLAGTDPLEHP